MNQRKHFMEVIDNIGTNNIVYSNIENKTYLIFDENQLEYEKEMLKDLCENENVSNLVRIWAYHKIDLINKYLNK